MKTLKTLFLTAALLLTANILTAGTPNPIYPVVPGVTIVNLAPVLPAEATFTDMVPAADYREIIPNVPAVADFTDSVPSAYLSLAPAVPSEADFE